MATQNVAIIGSGLSGLSLALALKKYNIRSTVYEFRPMSYTAGGEISLSPNALRVLDHLGIYQSLRLQGFNSDIFHLLNRSGFTLGLMQQGSLFGYSSLRLPRPRVRETLLKEVKRQGLEVRYEKRFVRLEEGDDGVKVWFEDGEMVDASLVVGADGIRSSVRSFVDVECKPAYSGTMVLYGMVSKTVLDKKLSGESQRLPIPSMLFGREGSFAIWPSDCAGEGEGYFANIEVPDRSKDEWKRLGEDKNGLRQLLEGKFCQGGWPEQVQLMIKETPLDEFKIWPVSMIPPLVTWRSPSSKVVLIGDAAHAIPPSGGVGGAMAFEDAESLAYALSKSENNKAVLTTWENHRKERVKQVVDFTNLSVKVRRASQYSLVQTIKEWFIWGLLKIRGQGGYRWLYGYDAEIEMSKL